jgi:hypothetical protein
MADPKAVLETKLGKFVRLVSTEPDNGWEEDGDALSQEHFVQYFDEYRSTFEGALRLVDCAACDGISGLEGPTLFAALFGVIDSAKAGFISKAAFKGYFLSKGKVFGFPSEEGSDDGYGEDGFEADPTPVADEEAGGDDGGGYGEDDFEGVTAEPRIGTMEKLGDLYGKLDGTAATEGGADGAADGDYEPDFEQDSKPPPPPAPVAARAAGDDTNASAARGSASAVAACPQPPQLMPPAPAANARALPPRVIVAAPPSDVAVRASVDFLASSSFRPAPVAESPDLQSVKDGQRPY